MRQKHLEGFSLILIIFLITALLIMGAAITRISLNTLASSENKKINLQAFYLAEAGIEKIKHELKKNPNWFTDLPRSPIDDINWIKNAAKGVKFSAPTGVFKIIREKDKSRAYSVGSVKKFVKIIKIEFNLLPFSGKSWKIL